MAYKFRRLVPACHLHYLKVPLKYVFFIKIDHSYYYFLPFLTNVLYFRWPAKNNVVFLIKKDEYDSLFKKSGMAD